MLAVSSYNSPREWYRTEHEGRRALWVTDWTDGAWIVTVDDEYLRPNLPLRRAFAERPDCVGLWAAVSREYSEAKERAASRVTPGCGAIGQYASCP